TNSTIDSVQKQLSKYQFNETILSQNLEQLNQKLLDVYREHEEFHEHNAQLILSKQQIEQQLQERQQQIDELQSSNYNSEKFYDLQQDNESLRLENQQLQFKLNDMEQRLNQLSVNSTIQRVDSPRENVAIHNIHGEREDQIRQLQTDLAIASAHCLQLENANTAWQSYQYEQIESLRKNLQELIPSLNLLENSSLDIIAQQIIEYLKQLNIQRDNLLRQNDLLKDEIRLQKQQLERPRSADSMQRMLQKRTHNKNITEPQIHSLKSSPSPSPLINEHEQELEQLRETVTLLTSQCAQLNVANQAWIQYQQTQLDTFKNTLLDCLPIDECFTFDQAAQQILNQITKEREEFTKQYQALEKFNNDLQLESATNLQTIKESYINTIDELNKELLSMKEQYEQPDKLVSSNSLQKAFEEIPTKSIQSVDQQEAEEIQQLRENFISLTGQLDETKQAWQQYQQTQVDILRNQLQNCLSLDSNISFDEIAQEIVDQITKEREDFNEKYQVLEKENDNLRSELTNNMESIRESYVNTVNELNQELLIMKKQCEQFDAENQLLTNELEKQSVEIDRDQPKQTIEKVSVDILRQPFEQVRIHTNGMNVEEEGNELVQLRENITFLTTQCAQLDEANRAWQLYQEAQLQNFRSKLNDYLSFDENASFDIIAQQIVEQISKEREDFNEQYQAIEKENDNLRSESIGNLETVEETYRSTLHDLNQKLLAMEKRCEELDAEKQVLSNELEKRSVEIDQDHSKPTIEKVTSNILRQPLGEVPIHTSGVNLEDERKELEQLRETIILLTRQCAQLNEANQAWIQYQQTQLDTFKNTLLDCLPIDECFTYDQAAQQILNQITKEREEFTKQYQALEKRNNDLQLESATNLETIKESYINSIDELNKELLSMTEQCEILNAEKQSLTNEVEKMCVEMNAEQNRQLIESAPMNLLQEVPLQTSASNVEQANEELQQLRESYAILTSQYGQLNEANRAWQEFHLTEVDNFRRKIQDFLQIDDDISFDHIAQKIIDQITKEREYSDERYQTLEKAHMNLQSKSIQENKEFLLLKEQYDQILHEKQSLIYQIQNKPIISTQERDSQTIEFIDSNLLKQQTEMCQLQENLISLSNQLDETNHSWQQFEQTQFNLLKSLLPFSTTTSLKGLIQEIILHMNDLRKEIDSYKEKESQHDENKIEQELIDLQNHCTKLDAANHTLQLSLDNQINLLKNKLKDYIKFDNHENFDRIVQLIVLQFQEQKQFNENTLL
ncbi:unnamed protein product, partial [Rotaria sp. Silwood2]